MASRPTIYLGGQERRWGRVIGSSSCFKDIELKALISQGYLDLLKKSDVSLNNANAIVVPDSRFRLVDILIKNFSVILFAWRYDVVHLTTQAIQTYPAALFAKYIFRCRLVFSYTGTSIDCHEKKAETRKFSRRVKLISKFADTTEVLNKIILNEGWPCPRKLVVSPCSFSEPKKFIPSKKEKQILWSGHFYGGKGIELFRGYLLLNRRTKYPTKVYGSSINEPESKKFESWLIDFNKGHDWLSVCRPHDMEGAYSKGWVLLSLQKISNYPSQVILEALLSGCQVIMTDTGDSNLFNCPEVIHLIDKNATATNLMDTIRHALSRTPEEFVAQAREYVLSTHTIERYLMHLEAMWVR